MSGSNFDPQQRIPAWSSFVKICLDTRELRLTFAIA
jgi:hypothetical protein